MPFSLSSSALNDYQRYLSLLVGNTAYVATPPLTVDYLVIAGGGGGGARRGGGGGAGGYRTSTGTSGANSSSESSLTLATSTNYTVTVGAGGAGGSSAGGGIPAADGTNGSNSVFNTITATGGGGGTGDGRGAGKSGGSGGGGSSGAGGSGTANQGKDGGLGSSSPSNYGGGGGGGATADGVDGTSTTGGNGGNGLSSSITGTAVTRTGGGGGGVYVSGTAGLGGTGGGGNAGAGGGNNAGSNGTVNTGSGGGASSILTTGTADAGAGGSGLVVVKYPITYDMTVGAGLGYKTVMSGDYKITEFTSGTGTVSFAAAPTVVGSGEDILQEIVLEESASSVTFSGLDAYASTYQHLQIRAVHAHTSSNGTILAQFNSDTGSNYRVHALRGTGSAVNSADYGSRTSLVFGVDVPNTTTFAAAVVDILDPFETTKYTTIRSLSGYGSGGNVNLYSGLWLNTNALASINIASASGNLNVGSRFTLIGVK